MNLILGILVGAAVGWAAFRLLRMNTGQGIGVSLAIGVFGGGMGVQFAPMVAAPVADGQLNVFALVIAAAVASALLVITSMISSRRGG